METKVTEPKSIHNTTLASRIVSRFITHGLNYLVLAIEAPIASHSPPRQIHPADLSPLLQKLGVSDFEIIDTFSIQQKPCVIIQYQTSVETQDSDLTSLLTARELQIATLVAQGLPNKKVAKKLHISEWTVATHLRRIFAKLNVDSRAAMVYRCANYIQSLAVDQSRSKPADSLI